MFIPPLSAIGQARLSLDFLAIRAEPGLRAQSIPPRVGQTAFEVEAGNLHLAANSWNQHEQPRICIFKVEEQHNTPVRLRVAMHEPVSRKYETSVFSTST